MISISGSMGSALRSAASRSPRSIFNSAIGKPSGSRLPAPALRLRRTYADVSSAAPLSDDGTTVMTKRTLFSPKEIKNLMPEMTEMGLHRGDYVTVAMSGGVDSSVALRILSEMPINLSVVYMRNWDPQLSESELERLAEAEAALPRPKIPALAYSGHQHQINETGDAAANPVRLAVPSVCQWEKEYADVRAVAKHVGIPDKDVRLVDFTKEYWNLVFEPSVAAWEHGRTPNPDVMCNREIKFGALMRWCEMHYRDQKLATGHYARAARHRPHIRLCKAQDRTKDQSYYLSSLVEQQLRKAVLPLGAIKKHQVRRLAKHWGLPTADKEESMGICFVGERQDFGAFVSQYMPAPPSQGYLVDSEGNRLAEHSGLWHYTIGQRAKLQGKSERWFIAQKGVGESGQDIRVVPGADHPALLCHSLTTGPFNWISGKIPSSVKLEGSGKICDVMIRHRMEMVKAKINLCPDAKRTVIRFAQPLSGVAEGQVAAVYFANWCLGSGVIESTRTVEEEMKAYNAERKQITDRKEAIERGRQERKAARKAAAELAAREAEAQTGEEAGAQTSDSAETASAEAVAATPVAAEEVAQSASADKA